MKFLKAILLAVVIGLAILGAILWKISRVPPVGGDFQLTFHGQPWEFSRNAPKLTLLYFGYVKCPDVCPLTLSRAGDAFRQLSADDLKKVRLIFVSVDQAHDTPQSVADYAASFFPSFVGLSGSKKQIDDTIRLYPASYIVENDPKSYLGYSISHTDKIFFLNDKGIMIDSIPNPRDAKMISQKIKENL
jgi:protein SCO1/2